MNTLDLYKERKHSEIKLSDGITYKIPNEYTVEEVERLLELQMKREKIENAEVVQEKQEEQIKHFHESVFAQLEVIFQHYQPEMTTEVLKKKITINEALEMVGFFEKHRLSAMPELLREVSEESSDDVKKKLKK